MRVRIDRPCTVWASPDAACWSWRCSVCTADVFPFTGRADGWESAYGDADQHVRTEHPQPHRQPSVSTWLADLIPFPRKESGPLDSSRTSASSVVTSDATPDLTTDLTTDLAPGVSAGVMTWRLAA